jgi:hypothetical protein
MTDQNPRPLPVILYNGKKYFVDHRLHQMRNVTNPNDCIQF